MRARHLALASLALSATTLLGACFVPGGGSSTTLSASPASLEIGFYEGEVIPTVWRGLEVTNTGTSRSGPLLITAEDPDFLVIGCHGAVLDPDESCTARVYYVGDTTESSVLVVRGGSAPVQVNVESYLATPV